MDAKKPIIVFTTFWDAKSILQNGGFIFDNYVVRLKPEEIKIHSIALAQPKDLGSTYPQLSFFCPTWDMLKSYRRDKDWEQYVKDYKGVLKNNQKEIKSWLSQLEIRAYLLCCWENTCKGAHCHRDLIYQAFTKSKATSGFAKYIYRHGDKSTTGLEKQVIDAVGYLEGASMSIERIPEPEFDDDLDEADYELVDPFIWNEAR